MISLAKKVYSIFNRKQKIKILGLGIMILIGAILETLGVSMILPLVSAILNLEELAKNEYVILVCQMFSIDNMNNFVILLLLFPYFYFLPPTHPQPY